MIGSRCELYSRPCRLEGWIFLIVGIRDDVGIWGYCIDDVDGFWLLNESSQSTNKEVKWGGTAYCDNMATKDVFQIPSIAIHSRDISIRHQGAGY